MKKSLTIEDLKNRIGKPVFVTRTTPSKLNEWDVLAQILEQSKEEEEIYKYLKFISGLTVTFDKVSVFRFFDTEVSEEELQKILEEEEKSKKKTGYETVGKGDNYFFITSYMKAIIGYAYHWNDSDDVAREACANHFNDETLTINLARAECLRYQLRRFAALNGGIPSQKDWENRESKKYYIDYLYHTKVMALLDTYMYKGFGQIYFKSEKACRKALETFKDELLWYFTEFKEMLY